MGCCSPASAGRGHGGQSYSARPMLTDEALPKLPLPEGEGEKLMTSRRVRPSAIPVPNRIATEGFFHGKLDHATADCPDGCLSAVTDGEFAKDVLHVLLHRFNTDRQRLGDLFVG